MLVSTINTYSLTQQILFNQTASPQPESTQPNLSKNPQARFLRSIPLSRSPRRNPTWNNVWSPQDTQLKKLLRKMLIRMAWRKASDLASRPLKLLSGSFKPSPALNESSRQSTSRRKPKSSKSWWQLYKTKSRLPANLGPSSKQTRILEKTQTDRASSNSSLNRFHAHPSASWNQPSS